MKSVNAFRCLVGPLLSLILLSPSPAAARPLDPGSTYTSGLDLERLPESGFLAVWQRDEIAQPGFGTDPCRHRQAVGAVLNDAGVPVEGPEPLTFEGETENPSALRVAAAPLRSAWFPVVAYTTAAGLSVADLSGFEVRSPTLVSSCTVHHFDLISRGLEIWLLWSETCDGHRIRARRIGLEGRPEGAAVTLAEGRLAGPDHRFAVTHAAGGFYLAWVERESEAFGDGRRVVAARFDAQGDRVTDVVTVSELIVRTDSPGASIAAATLATSPDEVLVLSWRDEEGAIRLRAFSRDLEPLADPPLAGGGAAEDDRLVAASSPYGPWTLAWAASGTGGPACPIQAFGPDLAPLGGPTGLAPACDAPVALAFSEASGLPLAAWSVSGAPLTSCSRTEVAAIRPAGLPPMPQGGRIDPAEFPGFAFWVLIGGDERDPRPGVEEPLCLPETVCVSGALPGRTEVLLRIVGPKPNGRLWPTIVRFTTSQVEVWIEQLSTGEVEYYLLPGASPASESLDGLFDRDGFPPS